jgi:ketosteroid isomerase-like protein
MSETFQPSEMTAAELLDYWYEHVWHENIDYRAIQGAIDDHGPILGRDALRSYMQDWVDTVDDLELTPEDTIGSDTPVVSHLAMVVTLRDGKMIRGREYATREEALEAAGLSGEQRQ